MLATATELALMLFNLKMVSAAGSIWAKEKSNRRIQTCSLLRKLEVQQRGII